MNEKEEQRQSWDNIHTEGSLGSYYEINTPHPKIPKIIELFQSNNINKILDIGCGTGNNIVALWKNGFEVKGVDISPEAIKITKGRLNEIGSNVEIDCARFQHLPYGNAEFDGAICIQTLSHGYENDIEMGVSEIKRVLKEHAIAFLTLPGRRAKGEERYCLVKTADRFSDRVYIPTQGSEIGIPHFIFNQEIIKNLFIDFKIIDLSRDYLDYYSVIVKKK